MFVCVCFVCVCVFLVHLTSMRKASGDNGPRLNGKQREIGQNHLSLVSLPWTVNA